MVNERNDFYQSIILERVCWVEMLYEQCKAYSTKCTGSVTRVLRPLGLLLKVVMGIAVYLIALTGEWQDLLHVFEKKEMTFNQAC